MGADYKRAMPAQFNFAPDNGIAANVTRYFTGGGAAGAIPWVRYVMTHRCVIDRIYAASTVAPGAGETYIFTLMVNGVPSIITVTIAGAVQVANNSFANAIVLQPGDLIVMRVVSSLNAAGTGNVAASVGGNY